MREAGLDLLPRVYRKRSRGHDVAVFGEVREDEITVGPAIAGGLGNIHPGLIESRGARLDFSLHFSQQSTNRLRQLLRSFFKFRAFRGEFPHAALCLRYLLIEPELNRLLQISQEIRLLRD